MELLFEPILTLLGEACCHFIAAGGLDLFAGYSGYKAHRVRKEAKRRGEPPPNNNWTIAFWLALPLALVMTAVFLVSLVR